MPPDLNHVHEVAEPFYFAAGGHAHRQLQTPVSTCQRVDTEDLLYVQNLRELQSFIWIAKEACA